MHQKNYKVIDVRKPRDVTFNQKMINVVIFDDQIFLLPEKNTTDK